jgi:hypothetical protein
MVEGPWARSLRAGYRATDERVAQVARNVAQAFRSWQAPVVFGGRRVDEVCRECVRVFVLAIDGDWDQIAQGSDAALKSRAARISAIARKPVAICLPTLAALIVDRLPVQALSSYKPVIIPVAAMLALPDAASRGRALRRERGFYRYRLGCIVPTACRRCWAADQDVAGLLTGVQAAELVPDPAGVPELNLREGVFEIVWCCGCRTSSSRRSGSSGLWLGWMRNATIAQLVTCSGSCPGRPESRYWSPDPDPNSWNQLSARDRRRHLVDFPNLHPDDDRL